MNRSDMERLWAARRRGLEPIICNPADYKECDQCRAIHTKRAGISFFCGAYRFKEKPEEVRATAEEMLKRPYPVAAPVVPRLRGEEDRRAPSLGGLNGERRRQ